MSDRHAERRLASTSGTFKDIANRKLFFDEIATMRPEGWVQGTVDAIATASADGRRIMIKAVNYAGERNTLLARLQGAAVPEKAVATLYTVTAGSTDTASLERPDIIKPVSRPLTYNRELTLDLEPYSVAVVEIRATS